MIEVGERAYAYSDPQSMGKWISLYLASFNGDGKRMVAKSVTFEPVEEGDYVNPSMRLPQSNAQELMDSLWQCGLRPTMGRQSEGVTAAQARHLEDMRQVAFAKLNIEKPL